MQKTMIFPLIIAGLLVWLFCYGYGNVALMIQSGNTHIWQMEWVPSLDLRFGMFVDGLSLLFSGLIIGIGALIFIYSSAYMRKYERTFYFHLILFLFALSMLGLVLADHLILLFIFWELTSVTSYLLIGYNNTSKISRRNALQALLVTGGCGLVMFAGFVWLGMEAGTFYLSEILAAENAALSSDYANWIFVLIFIGAAGKSAQMPFHFWLPNAMAAPTPVSAYLHSATMVKAGIYLLARLHPVFSDLPLWFWLLAVLGGLTAVWASLLAIKQQDLKQVLAYTTLMALGTLTFLLAFDTELMVVVAMVFLVIHALYKACLFMVIGIIDQSVGTRKVDELGGLIRKLPHLWIFALLAGLSMAGIPPLFGFIGKELQYEAALEHPHALAIILTLMAANALMFVAAYMVAVRPFFGAMTKEVESAKPLHFLCLLPVIVLALLSAAFGFMPQLIYPVAIEPAINAVAATITDVKLALWHGVNEPFMLSVATFSLGLLGVLCVKGLARFSQRFSQEFPSIENIYFAKLDAYQKLSLRVTAFIHDGSLEHYLRIVISVIFATILLTITEFYDLRQLIPQLPILPNWIGVALSLLAVFGAYYAVKAETKIMALAALGASGFAMAGIFLLHGALDVAMTQLLVETLFVILAAALLWRVPEMSLMSKCKRDSRDLNILISVIAGVTSTLIIMVVLRQPLDLELTYFFEHASYAMAHGRNIVNVILVDFRAFDTFGEITVVAAAALGLWGLTRKAGQVRS